VAALGSHSSSGDDVDRCARADSLMGARSLQNKRPEPIPAAAQQQFAARARKTGTVILSFGHEWTVAARR
jgi:hypothetical protein